MVSIAIVDNGPVISLAERFKTNITLTLDHRHFGAIRPRHCDAFHLLPASG